MPLLRRLVLPLALLLALLGPARALAQAPAPARLPRIVASGALDHAGDRVVSVYLAPTADGRAVGTVRFVDHAARLRLRAQRVESLRVADGVTTIRATATVGRAGGYQLQLVLRPPSTPNARAAIALEVTGPAGAYRAEGDLVDGLARLPTATRAAPVQGAGRLADAAARAGGWEEAPGGRRPPSSPDSARPRGSRPAPAPPADPASAAPDESAALSPLALAAALAAQLAGVPPSQPEPIAPAAAAPPPPPEPATAAPPPSPAQGPPPPPAARPPPQPAALPPGADPNESLAASALALVRRLDLAPPSRPPAALPVPPSDPSRKGGQTPPADAHRTTAQEKPQPPRVADAQPTKASTPAAVPPSSAPDEPSALTLLLARLAASAAPAVADAAGAHALSTGAAAVSAASAPRAEPGAAAHAAGVTANTPSILAPLAALGAGVVADPELGPPARSLAGELRPLLAEEAAAHPAEAQALARGLESAVAAAQRERGPDADLAFAALLDRARAWRHALPDGPDRLVARDLVDRYRSLRASWARAAAATAAERASPDAWAAAAAFGISLVEDGAAIASSGAGPSAQAATRAGGWEEAPGGRRPLSSPAIADPMLQRTPPAGTLLPLNPTTTTARLGETDFPIPSGHFFTQTGRPGRAGYAVSDHGGVPFWTAFQQLGGVPVLGYPASHRFEWDGFTVQVFQRAVLQWRPERGEVYLVNVLDRLHAGGLDPWLLHARQTPPPRPPVPDPLRPWDDAAARLAPLDAHPALRAAYDLGGPALHGYPTADVVDVGDHYALRTQRTVLQLWKHDVPWAAAGDVTVALAGDILKGSGLLPDPWALEPLPWIETR